MLRKLCDAVSCKAQGLSLTPMDVQQTALYTCYTYMPPISCTGSNTNWTLCLHHILPRSAPLKCQNSMLTGDCLSSTLMGTFISFRVEEWKSGMLKCDSHSVSLSATTRAVKSCRVSSPARSPSG